MREIEFAFVHAGQPRREIKAHEIGQRHTEMCVAMRIHRDTVEVDGLVAKSPFDSGPGLPSVQNDGLVMQDHPLVEHMGVGSDCRRAPSRIMAGCPETACCIKAHHVGRCLNSPSPQSGDRERPEMIKHQAVGRR